MKKFWFSCVLALALVALIALGFAPTPGHAEGGHASKTEKKSSSGEETSSSDGSVYIHLQPMVLPIISSSGAEQLVTLLIDLQVKDLTVSEKIRQKMPRVQDSILQALYGGFGDGSLRQGNQVDIAKIKTRVGAAIDKSMGERLVEDVLIQAVAQRAL